MTAFLGRQWLWGFKSLWFPNGSTCALPKTHCPTCAPTLLASGLRCCVELEFEEAGAELTYDFK